MLTESSHCIARPNNFLKEWYKDLKTVTMRRLYFSLSAWILARYLCSNLEYGTLFDHAKIRSPINVIMNFLLKTQCVYRKPTMIAHHDWPTLSSLCFLFAHSKLKKIFLICSDGKKNKKQKSHTEPWSGVGRLKKTIPSNTHQRAVLESQT